MPNLFIGKSFGVPKRFGLKHIICHRVDQLEKLSNSEEDIKRFVLTSNVTHVIFICLI